MEKSDSKEPRDLESTNLWWVSGRVILGEGEPSSSIPEQIFWSPANGVIKVMRLDALQETEPCMVATQEPEVDVMIEYGQQKWSR